jgi:hypothetical protein
LWWKIKKKMHCKLVCRWMRITCKYYALKQEKLRKHEVIMV